MQIIKTETTKNNKPKVTVLIGQDKYSRLSGELTQWRKCKTNHLVSAKKHAQLEDKYMLLSKKELRDYQKEIIKAAKEQSPATVSVPSNKTEFVGFKNIFDLTDNLLLCIEKGSILAAVKMYKDATGLGLKECKEYVDNLKDNYRLIK